MITLISSTENPVAATDIITEIDDEDITLTGVFAQFIDFTRMMGYHAGSWQSIVSELSDTIDDTYSLFDWATDKMIDFYTE